MNYKDLRGAEFLSVDIETKDPNFGGPYTGQGYILGVAINDGQGFAEYFNLGHRGITPHEKAQSIQYLHEMLTLPIPKICAHGMYDLDWLVNGEGFKVPGPYYDILTAEPLLDEYARGKYNLDALSQKYLGEHKGNDILLRFCEEHGLKTTARKGGREWLYKMPYNVARQYALCDVDQPIRIFKEQRKELEAQGLWDLFLMETDLFPMLLQMKKAGVKIDLEYLEELTEEVKNGITHGQKELSKMAGFDINVNSGKQLRTFFDAHSVPYQIKESTGNPCFDKNALTACNHDISNMILAQRGNMKLLSGFLEPYKEININGIIRCNFNPLGSDTGGTVTGRFSSSSPNLQQVPKDKTFRKLFLPEEGHLWLKNDWSQNEYRLLAHYGRGQSAEVVRQSYIDDPYIDYHVKIQEMAKLPDKKTAKTLNFGTAYGMGWRKMAINYGWTMDYAQSVYNLFHAKVPFIRTTSNAVGQVAINRGYVKTILGRRARIKDPGKSYVMLNHLIQGSAADLMKKAMVDAYKAGIFNTLIPHLTVHDELDCSMPDTKEGFDAGRELKYIMENCVKLKVPIISDSEVGKNWGELEEFK